MHEFPVRLRWEGTTASADYTRNAVAGAPGKHVIQVSAGGAYGGDETRWNPEDLFGASLSACHMLTFLALAKKVGIDVRRYEEEASVTIATVDRVTRVTKVRLSPTITLAAGADEAKAREMFEKSHKYCFIANSTTAEVVMEPTIVTAAPG
jgi:organic hydroperoxide reductase OsmC/OhrA